MALECGEVHAEQMCIGRPGEIPMGERVSGWSVSCMGRSASWGMKVALFASHDRMALPPLACSCRYHEDLLEAHLCASPRISAIASLIHAESDARGRETELGGGMMTGDVRRELEFATSRIALVDLMLMWHW